MEKALVGRETKALAKAQDEIVAMVLDSLSPSSTPGGPTVRLLIAS